MTIEYQQEKREEKIKMLMQDEEKQYFRLFSIIHLIKVLQRFFSRLALRWCAGIEGKFLKKINI